MCIGFVHADSSPSGYRILINTASRTLKLYKNDSLIKEFPIAVGKPATKSPIGSFKIVSKVINPWWGNHGNPMPPGPNNPLGIRWMGLSAPRGSYGIHGNSTPSSISTFASGGCIRMFNNDVETLYNMVSIGTPVQMVYENIELKVDKYTGTPVLIVYPNMYKQSNAEDLIKRFRAENVAISDELAAKALRIANSSIRTTVAVAEGTPMLLNNQFVTNDAFIENGEAYACNLVAMDYFGLSSDMLAYMNIKTLEKDGKVYINMTDAALKIGGEIQYDKINNNIYITENLIKINGTLLDSYGGGFDKEYGFKGVLPQGTYGEAVPVFSAKQAVNLKDYTKEKNWALSTDSLYKIINISIPLRVKAGDKLFDTITWNNRYYLRYEDAASIPGIEEWAEKLYEYNSVKFIDLYELMEAYEYKKDPYSTVLEFVKPLDIKTDASTGNNVDANINVNSTVQ
jgi:hypothetical protein